MRFYLTDRDQFELNVLFGRALLDEQLQSALLQRTYRLALLKDYGLPSVLVSFLMSIDDAEDFSEFARRVYGQLPAGRLPL